MEQRHRAASSPNTEARAGTGCHYPSPAACLWPFGTHPVLLQIRCFRSLLHSLAWRQGASRLSSLHPLISSQGTERGQKETVLQAARPGRNALFPDKPARLMLAPTSSPRHGTKGVAVQLCHPSVPSVLGCWVRNRTLRDTKCHEPPGMKAHKACTLLPCCTARAMTGVSKPRVGSRRGGAPSPDITTLGGGDQPQAGFVKPSCMMSIPTPICSQLGVTAACQHS